MRCLRTVALVVLAGCLAATGGGWATDLARDNAPRPKDLDALRAQRRELAHRQRRMIFNNDGCDALYFPAKLDVTPENLLARRTTGLLGSQVDSIFYCTISSGFGYFTHRTKAGDLQDDARYDDGKKRNATRALIEQGTDPLQVMVDFGRAHGIEVFWSMRMNDTHDASHTAEKPHRLFSPVKQRHPEYLMGTHENRPKHGLWSAVDYTLPAVRDLAFGYIEEVCRNYAVDGVELDFFRHQHYFKSVSWGGQATDEEREMMTDLLRRIRRMTEEEGLKRGKPILIAVRVPDSVGYARGIGLDVERWLADGLIDIMTTTGYFRLNPWKVSAELAHKYDVPFYAGLSDSRMRKEDPKFRRRSLEGYRGRAADAWQAGADGIYLFNYFRPKGRQWRELGSPETLRGKDKLYFATVRYGHRGYGKPSFWLADGERFTKVDLVYPDNPRKVAPGDTLEIDLHVGDEGAGANGSGVEPDVQCRLWMPDTTGPEELDVALNGAVLAASEFSEGWLVYPVSPRVVKPGANQLQIALRSPSSGSAKMRALRDVVLSVRWPRSADQKN